MRTESPSGVEVFGNEWFFGASLEGLFHGVNCATPKQHPVHRYRTSATGQQTKSAASGLGASVDGQKQ